MRKLFFMLLVATLWTDCGDSKTDDENNVIPGSGSEHPQPISQSDILPKRIVSADVTVIDECSYIVMFEYDKNGRLIAMDDRQYNYEDDIVKAYDEFNTTYQLKNNRVETIISYECTDYWYETVCSYDTFGYLVSINTNRSGSIADEIDDKCSITYAANGFVVDYSDNDGKETITFEYDITKPNNLNIDLYGWYVLFENCLTELLQDAKLLGIAGERYNYLPSKVTFVGSFDGEPYKSVCRYYYRYEGEYIKEIKQYDNDEFIMHIVFNYE